MSGGQEADFERVTRLARAARLPEVTLATSYGTPALAVRGKSFVRIRQAGILVVMCAIEEKEMLMEAEPDLYFETDHYKGWPAMLVRLAAINDAELTQRLLAAWRQKAPKRLAASFGRLDDDERPTPPKRRGPF
jgi:hypothetical protein